MKLKIYFIILFLFLSVNSEKIFASEKYNYGLGETIINLLIELTMKESCYYDMCRLEVLVSLPSLAIDEDDIDKDLREYEAFFHDYINGNICNDPYVTLKIDTGLLKSSFILNVSVDETEKGCLKDVKELFAVANNVFLNVKDFEQ